MDEFDALVASRLASRKLILERVDEYTLYCFYLDQDEIKIKQPILSPIPRKDNKQERNASFVIYPTRFYEDLEFAWNDRALNISGNIFHLIKLIYRLNTFEQVYNLIATDFDLGVGSELRADKICLYARPPLINSKIRIHSVDFTQTGEQYWERLHINQQVRQKYIATQIDHYWSYAEQQCPYTCKDPTFAYQLGGYYQIYSPLAPKNEKFRNDLPPSYFLGYLQLARNGDVLVIDKSMKDVMVCDVMNFPAVAGKSETTEIPEKFMLELRDRFRRIFLCLDPDEAGYRQTEVYVAKYPWLEPRFLKEAKDKSDLITTVGFDRAETIIKQLLI